MGASETGGLSPEPRHRALVGFDHGSESVGVQLRWRIGAVCFNMGFVGLDAAFKQPTGLDTGPDMMR